MIWERALRQSGREMPKRSVVSEQSMREFEGRFAGVGNALVGISTTSQVMRA
jgi:hypothetical protein